MISNHTLLLQAVTSNNAEEARSLLEQNVNPNGNHHQALFTALKSNHFKMAELLLAYGADINGQTTTWKQTPLTYFADKGDLNTVDWLLNHGADIESANTFGWTALGSASRNADRKMVEFLVDKGANLEHTDNRGKSIIDLAQELKHDDFVVMLKCLKEQQSLLDSLNNQNQLSNNMKF